MRASAPPLDTLQRIELAEGVEVELHPAGPLVRAMAYTLDLLWMLLIYFLGALLIMLLIATAGTDVGGGTGAILGFLAYWGYHVYFEAGRKAATPGKRAMGLKVVAESGGPASLGAIMLRNLARVADAMPFAYFTGMMCCLFTRRFQRLGDLVARTVVVYANPAAAPVKSAQPPLPAAPQPPPLALTREERSAIVLFRERSPVWSAARREELAAHAAGLTHSPAPLAVQKLNSMAVWLRDS
jgi:uncharacterized RDD family membrane protein YckC